MEMNNAIKTKQLGQSIWYDNIDREDLKTERCVNLFNKARFMV